MPYDWRTGLLGVPLPNYNPAVHPSLPFTPATIAAWGTPYGTKPPPPAGYATAAHTRPKPPRFDPFSNWQQGHPGVKPAVKPAVKPKPLAPPVDPWQKLYEQILGSFESPAQREARVQREVDAQIAAQKKLYDDEYARQQANAQAMARGQEAAGAAAAAMSRDLFGAVGGEYNAAAGEIKGLAHGLTGGVEGATSSDIAAANQALGESGNAAIGTGGAFEPGGSTQQGVEEYRGGTLGGQMFGTQGEAANFGLAGMLSSQNMKAHEEAQAALITASREINDNQNKAIAALAAGRGDLYHTYMQDAQDAQIKYISVAQGIQAMQSAGQTKPITKMVNGNLMQWNPLTGKWVKAVAGGAAAKAAAKAKADAAKAAMPDSALSKIYGHVVDHNGNMIPGADGKAQPIAKSAAAQTVNMPLSRAARKWVDASGKPIPSLNRPGMPKPPPFFKPGTTKKSGTDKVTREDLQQAGEEIRAYQLYQRSLDKLKAYNAKVGAGKKDWNPITPDELSVAPSAVLDAIGLTAAERKAIGDPHTLQEVYISLAHSIGGRRAWQLIRKTYPNFGQGYYT